MYTLGDYFLKNESNIVIQGNAQQSFLVIYPGNDQRFFTRYECIAKNELGEASHFIELKRAEVPRPVQQVKIKSLTATTVKFDIVPPPNLRGLPLRSITVWYKDLYGSDPSWNYAFNHTWSVGKVKNYSISCIRFEWKYHKYCNIYVILYPSASTTLIFFIWKYIKSLFIIINCGYIRWVRKH